MLSGSSWRQLVRPRRRVITLIFVVLAAWWIGFWSGIFGEQLCPAPAKQEQEGGATQDGSDKVEASSNSNVTAKPSVNSPQLHAHPEPHQTENTPRCSYYRAIIDRFLKFVEFKITDFLIVFFTAILAFKTSSLDRATRGLQRAAVRQTRDTNRAIAESARAATAMETSLDIARQSVAASLDSTKTAREVGEATIRAYVFVQNINFSIAPNNCPLVQIEWKNSGQTPGKNVSIVNNFVLGTTVIGDKENPVQYKGSSTYFAKDIGSQDTDSREISFTCVIPPHHAGGQSPNPAAVYVYGDITFRDVFGTNVTERFVFNLTCAARTSRGNPTPMERLPAFDGNPNLILR